MTDTNMYVALTTLTMDGASLTKENYGRARNTWLCTGCSVPKPEVRKLDVNLEDRHIDKPLNFECGLGLVYRPFLEKFPAAVVGRDLYLGRVFGPNGEEVPDWVTYRGRRRIIIRGTKHANNRVCEQCGRDVYFAMGKKYLYPAPPTDVTIFADDAGGGIVIPEELFAQLDLGKWRKLSIDRLPVLDEPLDGLGILANA